MIQKKTVLFHQEIRSRLQSAYASGTLHHAYLFTGPRGIGKATMAVWLAQAVCCEKISSKNIPCGTCDHCRAVAHGTMPDVTIVGAERSLRAISIREVRDAQVKLSQTPLRGNYSVCILLDSDRCTIAAQNALLKTLEEPYPRALLILTAAQPSRLLPTIHSRVVAIPLKRVVFRDMMRALQSESVAGEQCAPLARYAAGIPGRIFENFKLRGNRVSVLTQVDALKRYTNAPFWELQAEMRKMYARYGNAPDALPQLLRNEMALLCRDQPVSSPARKTLSALWSAEAHHVHQELALDLLALSLKSL
ncbi:MAG: hypothetical protein AB1352_04365 [Patescibacteria group bacterium]